MKAVILAGGRGSRLGRLTESKPKPLIEIAGKPILEWIIMNASQAGIEDFVMNIGYLGNKICEHFDDGSRLGVKIEYYESMMKGPEQAVFAARPYLKDGTFCCFCGDNIISSSQMERILQTHYEMNADATFTLEKGETGNIKRVEVIDNRVIGTGSLGDHVLVYNMAMQTAFLDELYEATRYRVEKAFAFAMNMLSGTHRICALEIPFININYPEDIAKAEKMMGAG